MTSAGSQLLLSCATADITPAGHVPLAGFAAHRPERDEPPDPLSLQVFVFGERDETGDRTVAILICADLLWWGPDLVRPLRDDLARMSGLAVTDVFLHASHTHSAPMPGRECSPQLGPADEHYLAFLTRAATDAAAAALAGPARPVRLATARATHQVGMNRRLRRPDGVGGLDPDGERDDALHALAFVDERGEHVAVLVHHSCHPVINRSALCTPDFPAGVREELRDAFGSECVAAFVQGCCGDVNPAVLADLGPERGDAELAHRVGRELGAAAVKALAGSAPSPATPIRTRAAETVLDLDRPSDADLDAAMTRGPSIWPEWAEVMRDPRRRQAPWTLHGGLLAFGDALQLVFLDAEVVSAFGLRARRHGGTLIVGYTNGMVGYLVTRRQLAEGGYEPDESWPYVYRPGRLSVSVEDQVHDLIDALATSTGGDTQ